jgi:hypothetical protein
MDSESILIFSKKYRNPSTCSNIRVMANFSSWMELVTAIQPKICIYVCTDFSAKLENSH